MPAPSDPCKLAFALCLLASVPAAAWGPSYWVRAVPQDIAETEVRDVLAKNAFGGATTAAPALRRVSEKHPGTTASGLARLGAGLLLLEAGNAADAIADLRHPDVRMTSVPDHALLALGQALDAVHDPGAAQAYLAAADERPDGPLACAALLRAADVLSKGPDVTKAIDVLTRALESCPAQRPSVLFDMASAYESSRNPKAAAETYDRLDHEYPASTQARDGARRLGMLASLLPEESADARNARDLKKALALFDAEDYTPAAALLQSLKDRKLAPADLDLVRVRLGRILLAQKHVPEAEAELAAVTPESPCGAEAAFHRAKIAAQTRGALEQYEAVAAFFPNTPWGEEALLALANEYQKDARDDEALPYFRRLLDGFPSGRYADRAAWRLGWGDYRRRRFEEAATGLERAARQSPGSLYTPGMLYWAARARRELGQMDRARQLFAETAQRFKRAYHGLKAQDALARLPGRAASEAAPPSLKSILAPAADLPEPWLSRVRQLLLIERFDAAYAELKSAPASTMAQATIAWLESRRGQLRPAITAMKRAYPDWISEAGDALPDEVWRVLFPIQFTETLQAKALREGLDPALVAALVCQESTFDAGAVSRAGARGLMQVMPRTGRTLARALRVRYSTKSLHDPATSLTFGTRYLRQLMDKFEGRVERALAAYNAGPERVEAWTAARPDVPAEEFVESIPFTETRLYVMIVLANREEYRRIYDFAPAPKATLLGAVNP